MSAITGTAPAPPAASPPGPLWAAATGSLLTPLKLGPLLLPNRVVMA